MSSPTLCRLCVNDCSDCKSLYHDNGHGNDLYALTLKYFHPKIVDLDKAKHLTGICAQCCLHIYDFHTFEKSVLQAQQELEEDCKSVVVKWEAVDNTEEILSDHTPPKVKRELIHLSEAEEEEEEIEAGAIDRSQFGVEETKTQANASSDPTISAVNSQIVCKQGIQFELIDVSQGSLQGHCGSRTTDAIPEQLSEISLPKLELIDVPPDGEFNTDDEMPLTNYVGDIKKKAANSQCHLSHAADFYFDKSTKMFKCMLCPNTYPFKSSIKHHVVSQHQQPATSRLKFKCDLCENSFSHKNQLTKHMGLHHTPARGGSKPPSFKCSFCEKIYAFQNSLQRHMKKQHAAQYMVTDYDAATNSFKCRFCGDSFLQKTELTAHTERQHPEQVVNFQAEGNPSPFKCDLCGCCFNVKNGLKMHQTRKHPEVFRSERPEPNEMFQCHLCDCTYKLKRSLKLHMESKHPESLSYEITSYDLDSAYDETTKLYKCHLCGNSFRHKNTLSFHLRSKHAQQTDETVSSQDASRPRLKCNWCNISYLSKRGLRRHMKSQHPDKIRKKLQFEYDDTTQRFKCTLCEHSYKDKSNLRAHIRTRHTDDQDVQNPDYAYDESRKMFNCKLCGNSYMYKNKVLLHLIRQHNKSGTIFGCTQCSKEFVTKLGLKCHNKIHHAPSGVYSCQECGKNFKKLFPLRRHMYYHKVQPKHKCSVCGKAFKSPYQLRIHMKRSAHHHEKKVIQGMPKNECVGEPQTTKIKLEPKDPLGAGVCLEQESIPGISNELETAIVKVEPIEALGV